MPTNASQIIAANELETRLRKNQLGNLIANRNYEGEITGPEDTVKILTPNAASVNDHTGPKVTIETNVGASVQSMVMDHAKDFGFVLDSAENLAGRILQFADETFNEVLEQADKFILTNAADADLTFDFDATVATPDLDELFGRARQELDDEGVPNAQRFAVVPPSISRLVYKDLTDRDTDRGDDALNTGLVGRYYGFVVYDRPESFFSTSGTGEIQSMFGSRFYQTYGDAVVSLVVKEEPDEYTGPLVRGLHVAGSTLTQPKGFVNAEITTA